jgi:glycerophosphoryl diester phosphodiesterase
MKSFLLLFLTVPSFAFDWQGHRGARGLYPENTIGAMEIALKYPAISTLEFDVVVTKDKKVILSHEPWMSEEICLTPEGKKIIGKEFNLYKMSYDEIIKFDCGKKNHPHFPDQAKVSVGKPLLSALILETEKRLKNLGREGIRYNIEIKSTLEDEKKSFQPPYKEMTDIILKELLTYLPKSKFTIQSFDWRVLKYLHEKDPTLGLVALREESFSVEEVFKELGFKPAVFSPYYKYLSAENVQKFQQAGVKVIPWTVNSLEDMRKVKSLGVDGIITDYPNRIEAAENRCTSKENYFNGNCVRIPANAIASDKNPGWVCKSGYQQKRMKCIKIRLPKNALLLEDGKNWICAEGFVRYRGTCRKE